MARKSAAKVKVADQRFKGELPPIEEVFDDAKAMFVLTVETQVTTAKRVDNLMNIRDFCDKFWKGDDGHDDLAYYKKMQELSVSTYEKVKEAAETFELDEFLKDEIKDYFADIIPPVDSIETLQGLCEAALVFMSVQPYGGKLIQLHRLIQDEKAKREQ